MMPNEPLDGKVILAKALAEIHGFQDDFWTSALRSGELRAIAAYVEGLENSLKTECEYSKKLSVLMAKIAAEEAEYDED
jgi:hypothetical protein